MDQTLYRLAGDGRAEPRQLAALYELAVMPGEPRQLPRRLRWGMGMAAGLLLGAGLIFWIAANWQQQSRMFKLGLIEAALLLSFLLALAWPRARGAALLCAQLALGGLLAFVGQTYQTGADAWQLFAAWAALSLIWTLVARSDLLWAFWVGIAAVGLSSWAGRIDGLDVFLLHGQRGAGQALMTMALWLPLAFVPMAVSLLPGVRLAQGLGRWSHRAAMAVALACWTVLGCAHWFGRSSEVTVALVACLLVALVFWLALVGRWRDFVVLCLATLAVDVLAMGAVVRVAFEAGDAVAALFICSIAGLACLGGSAVGLVRVQRRMAAAHEDGGAA